MIEHHDLTPNSGEWQDNAHVYRLSYIICIMTFTHGYACRPRRAPSFLAVTDVLYAGDCPRLSWPPYLPAAP